MIKENIKAIALENKEGFTYDIDTMKPIKTGFAVAYKETQDSFNNEGLDKVLDILSWKEKGERIIGGWYNSDNDKFYYDAIRIVEDKEEAILFGQLEEQIAIYDLEKGEEILL